MIKKLNEKILNFIIGILVGICITTAGFLIYMKISNNNVPNGIPNMQKNVKQMNGFNKNGGEFNKEELESFSNKSKQNRNEGDINSSMKEESKGVPPSLDSTNN